MKKYLVGSVALAGILCSASFAHAQSAVAAPNFTAGVLGGAWDSSAFFGAEGKFALPISTQFGLQIDAGVGTSGYGGVAGHLFWREPNQAMLGVLLSGESLGGNNITRLGVEGELYQSSITFSGAIGAQGGSAHNGIYANGKVTVYPRDNVKIAFGGEITDDASAQLELEWKPDVFSTPDLSLLARAEIGGGYSQAMFGIELGFGGVPGTTLINRDRNYVVQSGVFNGEVAD